MADTNDTGYDTTGARVCYTDMPAQMERQPCSDEVRARIQAGLVGSKNQTKQRHKFRYFCPKETQATLHCKAGNEPHHWY